MPKFCSWHYRFDTEIPPRRKKAGWGLGWFILRLLWLRGRRGEGKGFAQHLAATQKSPGLPGEEGCARLWALKGTCPEPPSSLLTSAIIFRSVQATRRRLSSEIAGGGGRSCFICANWPFSTPWLEGFYRIFIDAPPQYSVCVSACVHAARLLEALAWFPAPSRSRSQFSSVYVAL